MKTTFFLTSLLLLFVSACEPAKPAAPVKPAAPAKQTSQQPAAPKKSNQSLRQEIQSAVDYGIGATQLEAKKRSVKKIDQISNKHNKELEDALK